MEGDDDLKDFITMFWGALVTGCALLTFALWLVGEML